MRIGILTTHLTIEEEALARAAKERGHELDVLEVLKFGGNISLSNPQIHYKGERVEKKYDAIIPRLDPPHTEAGFNVLRQFQALGVYVTDTAYSLELARNKLRCMQYLLHKNVPLPKTAFTYSLDNFDSVLKAIEGPPAIIKLNEGTEGVGVFLAEEEKDARNLLRTFKRLDHEIIMQEFIKESAGTDLRCDIIGGKLISVVQRMSQCGDFRANLSLGGKCVKAEPTEEEKRVALEAAAAIGLNIAGVDLIRSDRGPLVIEINGAMDFAGPNEQADVSNVDFAGEMIDYAVRGKELFDSGEGVWLQEDQKQA